MKIEARLNEVLESALNLYMADRHSTNRAEFCKTAIAKLLEDEGYIRRKNGGYELIPRPRQRPQKGHGSFSPLFQVVQLGAAIACAWGLVQHSSLNYGKGLKDGHHAYD